MNSFLPIQVLTSLGTPLGGVTKVVAGARFACALRGADGSVHCWGSNVGDGRGIGSISPVAVPVINRGSNVALVAAADIVANDQVAFARIGTEWLGWGNSRGALGQGGPSTSTVANPIASQPRPGFVTVAVGNNNACGIVASGEVHCWGNDIVLQGLGAGELDAPNAFPILNGSREIALSSRVGFALDGAGTVRAFGDAGDILSAGLGGGVAGDVLTPTRLEGLDSVKQVAVGINSACALQTNNTVRCWGANNRGQIGNGGTATAAVPVLALPDP